MASSESSPLMKLPGEIRNRIYRFSVAHDDVPVTRTGMTEPGLLLACKAIRKEVGGVFYTESTIKIDVTSYDPTALRFWATKSRRIKKEFKVDANRCMELDGYVAPHWDNLYSWLKFHHQSKRVAGIGGDGNQSSTACLVRAMFNVVRGLRSSPWSEVEKEVRSLKKVLEQLDPRWKN